MASLDTKALVFSCLACRAIVADSSDIITGVERPLQFILVAGVTGVREEPEEQHAAGDGAIVGRWGTVTGDVSKAGHNGFDYATL